MADASEHDSAATSVTADDTPSETIAEPKANATEPAQTEETAAMAAEGEREAEGEGEGEGETMEREEGADADTNATAAAAVMEKEVLRPPPIDPVAPEVARLHLAIAHAFKVFDHEGNNTVDVRELGTVVRSLGCCPSEAELHQIILECDEEEPTGFIKYERFEATMTRLLQEKSFMSADLETLRDAFAVLDTNGNGQLDPEVLGKILMEEGEAFTSEEVEEMMSAAVDPDKQVVYYENHAMIMALDEEAYGRHLS